MDGLSAQLVFNRATPLETVLKTATKLSLPIFDPANVRRSSNFSHIIFVRFGILAARVGLLSSLSFDWSYSECMTRCLSDHRLVG